MKTYLNRFRLLFLMFILLLGCSSKVNPNEKKLVDLLFSNKIIMVDTNGNNVTDSFIELFKDDYNFKRYNLIYNEMMKYELTTITDINGLNVEIHQ